MWSGYYLEVKSKLIPDCIYALEHLMENQTANDEQENLQAMRKV